MAVDEEIDSGGFGTYQIYLKDGGPPFSSPFRPIFFPSGRRPLRLLLKRLSSLAIEEERVRGL